MLFTQVLLVAYIVELLTVYVFFSQGGKRKYKTGVCLLIGLVLFYSALFVNVSFGNRIWINLIYFPLMMVLFGYLCFDIELRKIVAYSIILMAIFTIYEFGIEFLLNYIFDKEIQSYFYDKSLLIMLVSLCKTLSFLTATILSRFIVKDNQFKIPITLYIYPFSVLISMVIFWYVCAYTGMNEKGQLAIAIISFIFLLPTIFLFLTYQKSIEKENELLQLKNEMSKIETEMTYYDILERQNQDLMIYAHDTKNHLSAIKNLSTSPQIDEYIDKMTESLEKYRNVSHSGNHTLDVIISKYVTECKIKDIKFSYDVRLKNLEYVEDFDLVTILGNLLDNALESVVNSQCKEITLSTDHRNTYDVLIITNSCDTSPKISNNRLVSTKKDKRLHGIGLKSVLKTLKKYNGDYEWEYDEQNKTFTSIVMLANK